MIIDCADIVCGRVCVTLWCVSICLSVCPIHQLLQQRGRFAAVGPVHGRYRSIAAWHVCGRCCRLLIHIHISMAVCSKCEQCYVVSWHRKLNTDLLLLQLLLLLLCLVWRCWLGGRKGIQPVENWVVNAGVVSVWSEVQTCMWPSWCHCHSLSLASVKSRLVLPFWYRPTQVVPEKGPLNGCVCVAVTSCLCTSFSYLNTSTVLVLAAVNSLNF